MVFTTVDQSLLGPYQSSAYTFLGMGRNRIINGAMLISQENAVNSSSTSPSGTARGADLFDTQASGGGTTAVFSAQNLSATPPTGFKNYYRVTTTTSEASPTSGVQCYSRSYIEGYNCYDFLLGASSAKTITLSFWVRSSLTGTFSVGFKNENSDRGYASTYIINSANTWEQKTVTFTGDLTGTWEVTNLRGIQVLWDHGAGSNFETTANTWTAGNKYKVNGTIRLAVTNGATWDLTGVQMELGSTATPFEYRFFPFEIILCQRYFEKSYDLGVAVGSNAIGFYESSVAIQINTTRMRSQAIYFKVPKRASPTVSLYTTAGTSGQWNWVNTSGVNTQRVTTVTDAMIQHINIEQTVAVEYLAQGQWVADARL